MHASATGLAPNTPSPRAAADERSLAAQLLDAMRLQLRADDLSPDDRAYLESRCHPAQVRRVVDAFKRYRPFLPSVGNLLDFGCGMGADSLLTRAVAGTGLTIHGGDLDAGKYRTLRDLSGMRYTQLAPKPALPYPNGFFSAVIASGVIEHVPMDNETLKELHRVLIDGGTLIVTFLPNALSYTEFLARRFTAGGHQRRYTRRGFTRQLLHHGFSPITSGYHQLLPSGGAGDTGAIRAVVDMLFKLNGVFERVPIVRCLSANTFHIARAASCLY